MSQESINRDTVDEEKAEAIGRVIEAIDLVAEVYGFDQEGLAKAVLGKIRKREGGS